MKTNTTGNEMVNQMYIITINKFDQAMAAEKLKLQNFASYTKSEHGNSFRDKTMYNLNRKDPASPYICVHP